MDDVAASGIFNLVEGLIDHQLLGVHHVHDDLGDHGAPLSWDLGFLVAGVLLIVGGWPLHRRGAAPGPWNDGRPASAEGPRGLSGPAITGRL